MNLQAIRREVQKVLRKADVSEPPVPVERIAQLLDVTVKFQPFAGRLSGMLTCVDGNWVIGVNSLEVPVRRRFTIAHEIGHLLLHSKQKDLFIDQGFEVRFRDPKSSVGVIPQEMESNRFAAELLMPNKFLLSDLAAEGEIDGFEAEELIGRMARRYQVSPQAMTIRLTSLGLGDLLGIPG